MLNSAEVSGTQTNDTRGLLPIHGTVSMGDIDRHDDTSIDEPD